MERLPKKSYCKPCYKLCQRSLSTFLGVKFFNCHKHCNKYFNKHYLILYACVKNYMCHTYHNPRNQLPFPFQVKKNKKKTKKHKKTKKKQKTQKQELRIPQPPKPVTIPLSSKKKKQKKTKNPKTRTTHAHFFRLPHGLERSKRDIYIFIRTQHSFRLSG